MSNNEVYELRVLVDKIRLNKATKEDYENYEKILISKGFTKEQINRRLIENKIYGYDDLLSERKIAENDLQRRKIVQTVVVAGLLAFGLSLLLRNRD